MRRAARGFSLIELILAIVIISISVAGILMVFSATVGSSADPMLQHQAGAIAQAYLDEILGRPVRDPNGGETGGCEEGNPSLPGVRPLLDDVQDYNGLVNSPPQDQAGVVMDLDGDAVADLAGYTVAVTVTAATVGPGADPAPGFRIDVRVTNPPRVDTTLSGFRADY